MNTLVPRFITAVVGQSSTAATEATTQIQSIWDFILKGGPMMIPIGACSLFALAVIVERLVTLRRQNVIPPNFLSDLKAILKGGDDEHSKALEHCEANGSALAGIFVVGIKRLSEPVERLEKQVQEAGERAVFKLRKHLRALSVIAAICPLMGLLGTIFGMIKAFQTVATSGEALGKTELLAEGIYQAMITTAAGLLVAIPVIIAYHWISSRIDHLVSEMDRITVEFVEEYALNKDSQSPSNFRLQTDNETELTEHAVVAT
ncbi:MAG: MotA/TolQ/ExbB proton channel family protein [Phycisphaerales bacterium]|nr:MotA/TolQ/ExbB proton channel family protein [Phycisphaerales bacterium]